MTFRAERFHWGDDSELVWHDKAWDEGKHPRAPAGSPEGGQFTSDGGGAPAPEPGVPGHSGLLISYRPSQEKVDAWNKQINDRQEELNQAGLTAEHEDDQLNQMSLALSAYSQEDEKILEKGLSGLNVRYDLDNKLMAAAYTDIVKLPEGAKARISYFGALDEKAQKIAINDLITLWGNKVDLIDIQRWKNDPTLSLWEAAGFVPKEGQAGLTNLSAVILEKRLRNIGPAPDWHLPVPVSVGEGSGTDFQAEVRTGFEAIPSKTMDTLVKGGVKYSIGPKLTDMSPKMKGEHPRGWPAGMTWDSVDGMFDRGEKTVYVAETYRPARQKEFKRSDRARGALLHESGHAYDQALGQPSRDSKSFREAYEDDVSNIPKELKRRLGYFLQRKRGSNESGRSETFAELFAWHLGPGSNTKYDIRQNFPRTAKLVKQAIDTGVWLEGVML